MRHRADVTRAHRDQKITVAQQTGERLIEFLDLLDENGFDLAAHPNRAADRAAVGAGDLRLARRVHLGDEQHVRL